MCKVTICNSWNEPITTIVRASKRLCTAVAKAHYSGPCFIWKWH